ncbi:VOC family protein [Acidisoma silvae]|uniref:VOC family protein n=1 Tax=Acidisoma silvae TaxID=2802396 RepID=A0A963YP23_9PROT|nr:VOC family protein [Acidisoma silvae]MCB8873710.1 VOC family protein [Acidisoma silvae]
MRFTIDRIDHISLTCSDVEIAASWFQRVLGMEREEFGQDGRTALKFGGQKINLYSSAEDPTNIGASAGPGTASICFITGVGTEDIISHLTGCGVTVAKGPVPRLGALGPMSSVYCRDPDGNLIEIATYLED